jgi:hypothetical protein
MPAAVAAPVTDTIQMIPAQALCHLHMDPEQPTAGVGDGCLLASLSAEAIDTLIRGLRPALPHQSRGRPR